MAEKGQKKDTYGMRLISVFFLLMGCGSDNPGLHDVVTCDSAWNSSTGCERACEHVPTMDDMTCAATHPDLTAPTMCFHTFEFEGTRGCCNSNGPQPIRFFECQ